MSDQEPRECSPIKITQTIFMADGRSLLLEEVDDNTIGELFIGYKRPMGTNF